MIDSRSGVTRKPVPAQGSDFPQSGAKLPEKSNKPESQKIAPKHRGSD